MNPFILSGYSGKEYFCDRQKELETLSGAFQNGRNVTMFSLRRMGKSALIQYLFENLRSKANCIYADIFPAQNFREFTSILANAVVEFYGNTFKDYIKQIAALIKSINATMYFDDLSGKPKIRIGIDGKSAGPKNLDEIISFLEKRNRRTLLVFDEFQQIRRFPENNTEALLRSRFQNAKNINLFYLGSNRGMMESIFSDTSKPFYQSTQLMQLEEINSDLYSDFIIEKFRKGRIKISKSQAGYILSVCRGHTYYVQQLCNRLYSKNFKGKDGEIQETLEELLKENEPVYTNYRNLMTKGQWNIVKAIAKEGKVPEPYADMFIKKYMLGQPSSVRRAVTSMMQKEIITFYKNNYIVYDTFFSVWLSQLVD